MCLVGMRLAQLAPDPRDKGENSCGKGLQVDDRQWQGRVNAPRLRDKRLRGFVVVVADYVWREPAIGNVPLVQNRLGEASGEALCRTPIETVDQGPRTRRRRSDPDSIATLPEVPRL